MIDCLFYLYLLLLLTCIKSYRRKGNTGFQYLDINTTSLSKGGMALLVLFSHISYEIDTGILFPYLKYTGYLAVSVFFFISGYGTMTKHINDPEYKKSFITKRYTRLIIMYLLIYAVFFTVRHYGLHENISLKDSILMSLGNHPFVAYSWYLFDTIVLYFAFWIFMKLLKNRYSAIVLYMSVFLFAYAVLLMLTEHGFWWFVTMPNYIVGMFFAINKDRIVHFFDNYRGLICIILMVLFTATFAYYVINTTGEADNLFMIFIMISSSTLFVLLYSFAVFIFQFKSKVLLFFGSISLPFFLIQNMFNEVLPFKDYCPNELIFAFYSLICTTLSAFILTNTVDLLFNYLIKPLKRWLSFT